MELVPVRLKLAGLVILTALVAACTEDLDSSAGCPLLCPDPGGGIQTVTIDPVVLDTTVSALTGQGTETSLLLATRGDTVDARAVIRFDSIPARFRPSATDTTTQAIATVDSVRLRLVVDTTDGKIPDQITIDAYDVNSTAPDSSVAAVAALFRPNRLLGSQTYARAALKDTVTFGLPPQTILNRLGGRLRIGLRARATRSVQLRIGSTEFSGTATQLSFRVSPDTTVLPIVLFPYSTTPADQPALASSLRDYTLLVKGTALGPSNALNIGGLPARRVYLRFDIPAFLLDSVDVIRASLLLTQRPNPGLDPSDTLLILPFVSLAGVAVGDVAKAAQILALASGDTLRVTPGDIGVKILEVASVISLWRTQKADETPRALVLVDSREGQSPLEARFFSIEATPELRPRLRISYSTRKSKGLP